MTTAAFRNLVFKMAKSEGTPYLNPSVDVIDFYDLVQIALDNYTAFTQCLQSDNVTFTPVVGLASYDTGSLTVEVSSVTTTQLSHRVCQVRQVVINNQYLPSYGDIYGRPGPSSEYQMTQSNQGYLTAADGPPAFWWMENPNTLRFDKGFDQIYSNCFIAGRLYHAAYVDNDQVAIELSSEDIFPAARLGASMLLEPYSKDKAIALRQWAEADMKKRKADCGVKQHGASQRGSGNPQQSVDMVFGGPGSGGSPRRYRMG